MLNRALCDSPNVLAYQRNRLVQSRQPSEARILMLTGFSFMTSISRLDPKQTSPRIQILQQNCFEYSSQIPASVPGQARSLQPRTFNQTRREGAGGGRPSHGTTSCAHQQHTAASDPPRSTSEGHSCTSVRPLRNVSLSGILLITMMLEVSS